MSLDNKCDKNNQHTSNNVVRKGYLKKLKTLKKKYFVLRPDTKENSARLEYYDSEKKFSSNAQPKRVIPIKSCFNINRRLDTKYKHVIALYTKEEIFCIVLDSEEELRAWLNDLFKFFEDGSEEHLQPTQHVWLVNVQKRGLGATNNILGFHHLCLTDKSISLVKIKSKENVMYNSTSATDPVIEFSLKNIRRCGHSESFFYMEVGRLTKTGAGEFWMHTDDANIAESMNFTILNAMRNLNKDSELTGRIRSQSASAAVKPNFLTGVRQHPYNINESNDKRASGICAGSCINPCVTSTAPYEVTEVLEEPVTTSTHHEVSLDNQPSNYTLPININDTTNNIIIGMTNGVNEKDVRLTEKAHLRHQRTISLPINCGISKINGELKIVHERTRSLPLAGEEMTNERPPSKFRSSQNINNNFNKNCRPGDRCVNTGGYLAKWSPSHSKNSGSSGRSRCDSMPSRMKDELDGADWTRTIPEEEVNMEVSGPPSDDGYLPMAPQQIPRAYSVGSRPKRLPPDCRVRAFSVGSRRPASADPISDDLMELDFSDTRSASPASIARSPPTRNPFSMKVTREPLENDGYVDMSPGAGYVEMKPSELSSSNTLSFSPNPNASTSDDYLEMSGTSASAILNAEKTKPIHIQSNRQVIRSNLDPRPTIADSPDDSGMIFALDYAEEPTCSSRLATVNEETASQEYVTLTKQPVLGLNYASLDLPNTTATTQCTSTSSNPVQTSSQQVHSVSTSATPHTYSHILF